jgi:outer membrane protein OmpA-like peptidoglycan-associated protein
VWWLFASLATFWLTTGAIGTIGRKMDIFEIFRQIPSADSVGLRLSINDNDGAALQVGDQMTLRLSVAKDSYLTVIYVDSHGTATLLLPSDVPEESRISAGQELIFPQRFTLEIQPPVGTDSVLVLAAPQPIARSDLVTHPRKAHGPVFDAEAEAAPGLALRLREIAARMPSGSVATKRIDQRIEPRHLPGAKEHTIRDVVSYFGTATRDIRRPRLDFHITFEPDSSTLNESAKVSLDELGKALSHPSLRSRSFLLVAHTDDRGREEYNLALSQRQADAVRSYLIANFDIEPHRLITEGRGESQPLIEGTDEAARSLNRRVTVEIAQ